MQKSTCSSNYVVVTNEVEILSTTFSKNVCFYPKHFQAELSVILQNRVTPCTWYAFNFRFGLSQQNKQNTTKSKNMVRAGPGYTGDNYISSYGSKRWRSSRNALVQVSAFRKR